jgi:hypothetical protein
MQRTRTLIDLTSRTDTKLLNERIQRYRQLKGEVTKFNREVEGSGKAAQRSGASFLSLGNIVRTVFTVAIARQVVATTLEMARLAGNVDGVDRAFRRAFPNAEILIRDLREHTHGTINDFQLMQRTLQATNLGVTVEHLGVLFEFAAVRAQQTGESVDYLVDSIVRGIGRKSSLVLDNLGISTTRLKEEFNGAAIQAQSVGAVSAATFKIAGEELNKMGGFAETSATKVSQLEVSWEKLRQTIAKSLDTGGTIEFVREFVDSFQTLIEANERGIEVADVFAERERQRIAAFETEIFLQRNLTGEREKDLKFLEELIFTTQKDILTRNNFIATQNQMVKGMEDELAGIQASSEAKIIERAQLQKDIEFRQGVIVELMNEKLHRQEWLKVYLQTINAIKKGNEDAATDRLPGFIQEVEKQIADLNERIEGSRNEENIKKWEQAVFLLQGRLHELKTLGLPEFRSPEVIERVGKIIDEKIKKGFEDSTIALLNMEDVLQRLQDSIVPIEILPNTIRHMDAWDELSEAIEENWQDLARTGVDITANFLQDSMAAELESFSMRIDLVRAFYDEQILLAGDNERAKQQLRLQEQRRIDEIRKQQAQKEKQARRFSIIVDTAAALARIWVEPGWPLALAFTPLILANAALQLSNVDKAQAKGFYKGKVGIGGPGTGTSDSIPARLSKGESVINSEATKRSFHLLEAINGRKIDDRILQDLKVTNQGVKVMGMDPKPIVDAIKAQAQPDFIRVGNNIYEARQSRANFKRYVRSKSMSK